MSARTKRAERPSVAAFVAGGVDGGGGEVEAGDFGAAAGEDQAVIAEMALQVQDAQPGDGAELGLLDRVHAGPAGAEASEIVFAGRRGAQAPARPNWRG